MKNRESCLQDYGNVRLDQVIFILMVFVWLQVLALPCS